jgi:hypothetical protein
MALSRINPSHLPQDGLREAWEGFFSRIKKQETRLKIKESQVLGCMIA